MDRSSSSPGQSNYGGAGSLEAAHIRSALAELRKQAEVQVASLTVELDDIVESSRFVATDDEHDPDGSTVGFERAKTTALLDAAWARLAEVDAALARLDSGSYGACEQCGEPIGAERLRARPPARWCIRCAEPADRRGPRSRHC